jgi:hypothetical protein
MFLLLVYLVFGRVLRMAGGGRSVAELEVENLVLRHQLSVLRRRTGKRPPFGRRDRVLLAAASRLLPRRRWGVFLVSPQTLVRWHRELVRRKWSYRRRRLGRPPLDPRVREFVLRLGRGEPALGLCSDPGRAAQARDPGRRDDGQVDPESRWCRPVAAA